MRFFLAIFLLLLPSVILAQTSGAPQSAPLVKGDILYREGDDFIVKEMSGREVRIHVNGETKIEGVAGKLKTGDKIEATVTSEGHAQSIRLQVPDAGPASPPPVAR
jgi:hypothetical protein